MTIATNSDIISSKDFENLYGSITRVHSIELKKTSLNYYFEIPIYLYKGNKLTVITRIVTSEKDVEKLNQFVIFIEQLIK